jgi:hypothetical protein
MSEVPIVRDPPPEADRLRPGVLAAVALVSMGVGFFAVYLPGRGDEPRPRRPEAPPGEHPARPGETAERQTPVLAVAPRPAETAAPLQTPGTAAPPPLPSTPGAPSPEEDTPVPAGSGAPAAPGVPLRASVGSLYYWRCWDDGRDDPIPQEHCEHLRAIEPLVTDQLEAIAACARDRGAGPGKFSLGLELNFTTKSVRYWGGHSSTVVNAGDVAGCVRSRLRIDLDTLHHVHSRYTIFVPIDLTAR